MASSCANNEVHMLEDSEDDLVNEEIPKESKGTKDKKRQNPSVSKASSTEKKKKSPYWLHFDTTLDIGIVQCKYCEKKITAKSINGTSGLKNHTLRCKRFPANLDKKQKLIDLECKSIVNDDGSVGTIVVPKLWMFDQEFVRKALARMIIVDELPFSYVEREGFNFFCQAMNPEFNIPSRSTVTRDCYSLFIDERKKLKCSLNNLASRVCLTTDTWTSGQNLSYMCLTAHFIDSNWKLHKRILNFCPVAGHTGELIGKAVEKCLNEWNIKRILTVTVDNASSNDVAIQYLKRRVNHWGSSILESNYLHMRCAAHVLNLVVKDGLNDVDSSIKKIRGAVRYVRSSPARLLKFKACVEEERIEYKNLVCLDVETRWNSTFLMLETALKFKSAFDNLESKGGQYIRELRKYGGTPNESDWKKVVVFLPFLKIFYEATLKMSGSLYVTGNCYVPEIYGLGFLISEYCNNDDEGIRKMALQMKVKYNKYWANVDNINILLFVALVLDPRHKWDYVDWVVRSSYDVESANILTSKIRVALRSLFDDYGTLIPQEKTKSQSESSHASSLVSDGGMGNNKGGSSDHVIDAQHLMNMRYKREKGTLGVVERKSELERYLGDDYEPDDSGFDILGWWKDQKKRYPILCMIARDVLAIPISTVASESAFSTGGRVLDSFRTSLTPRMVEALICAQDWLRSSNRPRIIEENLLALEDLEDEMKELTVEQPTIEIDESFSLMEDY